MGEKRLKRPNWGREPGWERVKQKEEHFQPAAASKSYPPFPPSSFLHVLLHACNIPEGPWNLQFMLSTFIFVGRGEAKIPAKPNRIARKISRNWQITF